MLLAMSVGTADAQGLKGLWKSIKKEWKEAGKSSSGTSYRSSSSSSPQSVSRSSSRGITDVYKYVAEKSISTMPTPAGKPLPEAEGGWTLVKSNTIAGFKCDHYQKGSQEVRVFKKDNGDFITLNEDEDGLSREPAFGFNSSANNVYPIGEYRITTNDGVVVTGGYDDTFFSAYKDGTGVRTIKAKAIKYLFPSGDALGVMVESDDKWDPHYCYGRSDLRILPPSWLSFKTGKKETIVVPYDLPDVHYLYLAETPGKRYAWTAKEQFLIGDRVYEWDVNSKSITNPVAQAFQGKLYPAIATDTIVSATKKTHDNGYGIPEEETVLKYANGDEIVLNIRDEIVQGKIHRLGGVMTIKADSKVRIDYPNGKIFAGNVAYSEYNKYSKKNEMTKVSNYNNSWLSIPDIVPWTGTYEYPDGTLANITRGMSDKELAAEKAAQLAAEQKIKAEKAKAEKQELQALYNKYGKQYVDIAKSGKWPVVGMPIGLVKKFYDCRQAGADSYSQYYHLYGFVDANVEGVIGRQYYEWVMTIWVRNGRVSAIHRYY